jgi:asparagine synthetase B (glutamine-hydrolysing)
MVEFVLADPQARVFEVGGTVWMVAGSEPALFERIVERETAKGRETHEILQALSREAEEGSFAAVESPGGADEKTTLFKTLASTFELYFRVHGDRVQVFDHFRNALSSIPAVERVPDEGAFADHLLFAYEYLPGTQTLARGIHKMISGGMAEIGPDRVIRFRQAETLSLPEEGGGPSPEEAVDRLEEIMEERVAAYIALYGEPTVLLSGGVDSTLVLSCLGKGATSLTVGLDSPEYTFEMEYARMAGCLLEARHTLEILEESSFRSSTREVVETLGQPTGTVFLQPMAFHRAFRSGSRFFLYGEAVDALFGFKKLATVFDDGGLSPLERKAIDRQPGDMAGYAARCGLSPDFETARRVLGESVAENRLANRLNLALGLCPELSALEPGRRRAGHAEAMAIFTNFGHIREYIGRTRQQALCAGKTVMSPFSCRSALELAMSMPMPGRILKDGVVKHVAKSLLARRLPGYPVHTRKGGSDVPRTRFLQEGPLKGIFLEEKLPRFWPEEFAEILLHPQRESSFLALNALGYALWQNRVLENPDIKPVPGTRSTTAGNKEDKHP